MNILVRIKSEDSEKEINLHDWTSKNTCIRDKCYLLQVFSPVFWLNGNIFNYRIALPSSCSFISITDVIYFIEQIFFNAVL